MIEIVVGDLLFQARLETEKAPLTVATFLKLLPMRNQIIQSRWSGEAAWIPLGDDIDLKFENATSYPASGELILYPGGPSIAEVLFPYGTTVFASKVGTLIGNHFATIIVGQDQLVELGRRVAREGAHEIVIRELGGPK